MWERPLFYYLRRLISSEAAACEVLQETWLKVLKSLTKLRDPHALPAFLYTTARNTALSRMRRREFENNGECVEDVAEGSASDDIAAFENAEAVHHALDQLPL